MSVPIPASIAHTLLAVPKGGHHDLIGEKTYGGKSLTGILNINLIPVCTQRR